MKRLAYSKQFLGLALIATITLIPFIASMPKASATVAYTYIDDPTYIPQSYDVHE